MWFIAAGFAAWAGLFDSSTRIEVICLGGISYYKLDDVARTSLAPVFRKNGQLATCGK